MTAIGRTGTALGLPAGTRACLFDLDEVLTDTAKMHAAAWKEMFDDFLKARAISTANRFVAFDPLDDYDRYVVGKERADGTASFLSSRGIDLSQRDHSGPTDPPTIIGLGKIKNAIFVRQIRSSRVHPYLGSVRYVTAVRTAGLRTAVVSSSANCAEVLEAAGIADLFDARIDGISIAQQHLAGKPAPDSYLAAADVLNVEPGRAAVFEDALSGVTAGAAGCRAALARRGSRSDRSRAIVESGRSDLISNPAHEADPWCLRESHLNLDVLAQSDSVFALFNGHIGWRGNLDEGEPHGLPAAYLNGVFESHPLPYAETGYGYPEAGQTMINGINGKLIRLLVDDQPFDIRYGRVLSHERVLDFGAGVLRRQVEWLSPGGQRVRICSSRLVSFSQRSIAAISYEVEALDAAVRVVVQSELVANEMLPAGSGDPREAAAVRTPLVSENHASKGSRAALMHHTMKSHLRIGAAMDHHLDLPESATMSSESFPDLGRVTVTATLVPGQKLRVIKYVACGWSADLKITVVEIARWSGAATAMFVPYDDGLEIHCQAEGFTQHEVWDFASTSEEYPLLLHFHYFDLYRKQVVKQADLVLAMHLHPEAFTAAEKARNFAYYEALTVRDCSLSACTQSVMAAETGHLDLAYDFLTEAALMDLDDREHNTRDGLHIASLAGTWIALVPGLAGLRECDGTVAFSPRLPSGSRGWP
ncbi:HAD superfamily hydrolase (TIGR01509 family) [Nakamurella sp. UYEF19]